VEEPGHGAVQESVLNKDWVFIVPFFSVSVSYSPERNESIVFCFGFVNLKSKAAVLD
jgi:hypothetical protein